MLGISASIGVAPAPKHYVLFCLPQTGASQATPIRAQAWRQAVVDSGGGRAGVRHHLHTPSAAAAAVAWAVPAAAASVQSI